MLYAMNGELVHDEHEMHVVKSPLVDEVNCVHFEQPHNMLLVGSFSNQLPVRSIRAASNFRSCSYELFKRFELVRGTCGTNLAQCAPKVCGPCIDLNDWNMKWTTEVLRSRRAFVAQLPRTNVFRHEVLCYTAFLSSLQNNVRAIWFID